MTTTTHTPNIPTIPTGNLVTSTTNPQCLRDLRIVEDTAGVIQAADKEAGFQFAEFSATHARRFVKCTSEVRTVRSWGGAPARVVRFFAVETVVIDGVVMAGVGEFTGFGLTRDDLR